MDPKKKYVLTITKPHFSDLTSAEVRFLFPFLLFITNAFLSTTMLYLNISRIFPLVNYLCVMICIFNEFLYHFESKHYDRFEILGAVILFPLFLICYQANQSVLQLIFPFGLLFIFEARTINFKKISIIIAVYLSFLVFVIILLSFAGVITNYERYEASGRYRQYIGFRYALYPSIYCFNITMLFLCHYKEKLTLKLLTLLLGLNVLMFYFTKSRLAFGVSMALLLFSVLYKYFFKENRKTNRGFLLMIPSFGIISAASYYFSSHYNRVNSFYYNLDQLLENRVRLANSSINRYGIHLLGNPDIQWNGSGLDAYGNTNIMEYTFVDNFYVQLLLRYGVLFFFLFITLLIAFSVCLYLNHAYFELTLFFFISLYGIIDNQIMFLNYNTVFLMIGNMFANRFVANNNNLYHFINCRRKEAVQDKIEIIDYQWTV